MERSEVYKLIDGERDYQEIKWGPDVSSSGGKHSAEEWLMYMEDYLNEAKHILSREATQTALPKAMDCIRKITAMGVKAMEQIETRPR
jgi:hypothetical protein